ncbi:hypothetical protein [Kitasatospora indigofera]|uniref:hypothetical protein n=1 Tax=Kitasatospora indigofera TaxID=67307 RepID=UPI00367D3F97
MSPLRAISARLARRVSARANARPCCFGRCTTADKRQQAVRVELAARRPLCSCGCGLPPGQHGPLRIIRQRTATEES